MLMLVLFICTYANAQTAYEKATLVDNTYINTNIGASTPLDMNSVFPLNTAFGIKVGKNFSPIFGVNVEGTTWFNDNHFSTSNTFFKGTYVGVNGTVNLTNLFIDYNPNKKFELLTETGLGWIHYFNNAKYNENGVMTSESEDNYLGAKTGLVFAWNISNAWQFNVNPTVYWNLTKHDKVQFNKTDTQLALFVGFTYKFKTSNGTHNFKVYNIGELNNEINSLRAELAKKPAEVIKEVVKEKTIYTTSQYVVFFAQNSSELDDASETVLNSIDSNMIVDIKASSSPEGTKEYNLKLSQKRADVVKAYLQSRGVTINSADGIGVVSNTSNRVAVITIK